MNDLEQILKGQLVRLSNRGVFKIGLVIGPSKAPGKIRVCPWQNASRSWSQPQAEHTTSIHTMHEVDLSPREMGVVRRAQKAVADRGEVTWSGGALALRKVTL
jgi:hypothetical protein